MAKLEMTFRGLCAFVTDTRNDDPTRVTVVLIDADGAGHRAHRATLTVNALDILPTSDVGNLEVTQAPGGMLVAEWPIERLELSIASTGGANVTLENFHLIDVEEVKGGVVDPSCLPRQNPSRPISARFVIDRGVAYCNPGDELVPPRNKVEIVRYRIETDGGEIVIAATNFTGSAPRGTLRLAPRRGDTVWVAVSDLPNLRYLGEEHNTVFQSLLRDQGVPFFSGGACIPRRMFENEP